MVDAGNDDLPRGEFQKLVEAAVSERRNEAIRDEFDMHACPLGGARDRVIVGDSAAPGIENTDMLKGLTADSRRSTPDEVALVIAKHTDDSRVPRRAEKRWEVKPARNIPPVAGRDVGRAVRERRSQAAQPVVRVSRVRIAEDIHIGSARTLDRVSQVMYFLAAILCRPGDHNVLNTGLFQPQVRGIILRIDNEVDGSGPETLIQYRPDVLFKLVIRPFAGTEDMNGKSCRVAGSRLRSPAHVASGANAVEQRDESLNDGDTGKDI